MYERGNEEEKEAAEIALSCMREWGYEAVNVIPVGRGIAEQLSFKLRTSEVLPDEEVNDGFIIAECALIGCSLLLSSDSHLIEAGLNPKFYGILKDSDADEDKMVIGSPHTIATRFFRKR